MSRMIGIDRFEFQKLLRRMKLRRRDAPSYKAAELVIVDKYSQPVAAKAFGVTQQAVSQAVNKILAAMDYCPTCGRRYRV